MSLVEIVEMTSREQMKTLAKTIEGELKSACPRRTGEAQRSIHIEQVDETTYRIGGSNLHLYYADQGNNQRGGRIYPATKGALAFDGWGSYAGGGHGKNGKYVLPSVSAYEGKHFVKDVADRHR